MRKLLVLILLTVSLSVVAHDGIVGKLESRGVWFTQGNSMVLLRSGVEKFDDLFSAIRQAKHYVHLEYFNFRNDSIGRALFTLLAEKANEGVEVRAMFDGFGNDSNNRPLKRCHLDSIRATGVKVVEFDPLRFPYVNHALHRDHRKIVVIDGAIAYSGGMNVADYYLWGTERVGEWRDMHFRVSGPVVMYYEQVFADMWKKCTDEDISHLTGIPMQFASHFVFERNDTSATCYRKLVGVADRKPCVRPSIIRRAMADCIDSTRHHLQLISPYFIPTKRIWRALKRAVKRGVRVELMLSVNSDEPFTPDIMAYRANKLRKMGVEVYYFKGGFHHSKIMMFDDEYCTIGSTNLDARSLCFDYEINAFVFDRDFTRQLSEIFEADKERCYLLNSENYKQVITRKKLFVGAMGNVLTPIL